MIVKRRWRMIGVGGDCDYCDGLFFFGYRFGVWTGMDSGTYNVSVVLNVALVFMSRSANRWLKMLLC